MYTQRSAIAARFSTNDITHSPLAAPEMHALAKYLAPVQLTTLTLWHAFAAPKRRAKYAEPLSHSIHAMHTSSSRLLSLFPSPLPIQHTTPASAFLPSTVKLAALTVLSWIAQHLLFPPGKRRKGEGMICQVAPCALCKLRLQL
jgi:hypothetical protein